MGHSRNLLLSLTLFFFVFPAFAQSPLSYPTQPAGLPQGPFIYDNLIQPKKGELFVGIAKKKLTNVLRKNRIPVSPRSMGKMVARSLGLRQASVLNNNTYLVKGKHLNNPKIQQALAKGIVTYVENNYHIYAFDAPNDYLWTLNLLWGLNDPSDVDIDALEAWDITKGNEDVVVGVLDTGILGFFAYRPGKV